jgi:hypothetical protein
VGKLNLPEVRGGVGQVGAGDLTLLWQIFAADERDGIPKSVFQ